MKNFSIFAAFETKRTRHTISIDGIFCVRLAAYIFNDIKAVQIPAAVIEICQFFWSRMGGEQPFLYYIFSLAMTKRDENASTSNNSKRTNTPTGAKSVSMATLQLQVSNPCAITNTKAKGARNQIGFLSPQYRGGVDAIAKEAKISENYESMNLYVFSVLKAMGEFFEEERSYPSDSSNSLVKKIDAARVLFEKERRDLICGKIKVSANQC
jgi:hypothetical protein